MRSRPGIYLRAAMNTTIRAVLVLAGCLALAACRSESDSQSAPGAAGAREGVASAPEEGTIAIAAATEPVAWAACGVLGDPCEALALVPPGASAHGWEPRPSDLRKLARARFLVRTGLAFETSWTPRFQSVAPSLRVLDLRSALDLPSPEADHHHGAEAGAEPADPHVWASPRAMLRLAEALRDSLATADSALRPRLERSAPSFLARLRRLDTLVASELAPFAGRVFVVNHPGFGYLARDYGLVQRPLEENGQDLSPVDLWEVRKLARAQGVRAVFVQPEHSDRAAAALASGLGVPLVRLDLLAGPWDSAVVEVARRLAESL